MDKVLKELKLDNTLNKKHFRQKTYNSVFMEIPHHVNWNHMADLIELPETKKHNYKYLFTIVDLYSLKFDCEPCKNKQSQTVLDAMLKCFKRKYVSKPYGSLNTDNGSEFKSVFHKWLYDENVYHKLALPYRHKQQSMIESLNSQITKLIMIFLNQKSKQNANGVEFSEWDELLPNLRITLNEHRNKRFKALQKYNEKYDVVNSNIVEKLPKFKVGQVVHYMLNYPENFNMDKIGSEKFRNGDYRYSQVTRKIIKVLHMDSYPFYRYMLEGIPKASYSEYELLPASVNYSTFKVNKIIGKQTIKKKIHYLVWWKGELKSQATYEPKDNLIEDGLQDYLDAYEEEVKEKSKKEKEKLKQKLINEAEKRVDLPAEKPKPIVNNSTNGHDRVLRSGKKF